MPGRKKLPNYLTEDGLQTLSKHWKEINVVTAIELGRNAQCMDKQTRTNDYSAEWEGGWKLMFHIFHASLQSKL